MVRSRAYADKQHPDFLFPQMSSPELAPSHWEPTILDYLYLSLTNATAFSPTDTMPMSRSAKVAMGLQSIVSLMTIGLAIARVTNILKCRRLRDPRTNVAANCAASANACNADGDGPTVIDVVGLGGH